MKLNTFCGDRGGVEKSRQEGFVEACGFLHCMREARRSKDPGYCIIIEKR